VTEVASVRLRTPPEWWDLPLAARTRHAQIAALVDARVATEPALASRRNDLVAVLRRAARDAANAGAVFCSSLTAGDGRAAAAANLLVVLSGVPGAPVGSTGGTAAANALQAALAVEIGRDGATSAPQSSVVGLPGTGASVRVRALRTVDVTLLGRPVQLLTLQYFVPVPADGTAVLTFTSPSLAYADTLARLFDAVAATLAFLGPDGEALPPG